MKQSLFLILFLLFSLLCAAQITVKYPSGKQAYYHRGDTVRVIVSMKLNPQSCLDGMKKTNVYFSECEDILNNQWYKSSNNMFVKVLLLRINGRKKDKAKLTVVRDTDKESLFRQETFKIAR